MTRRTTITTHSRELLTIRAQKPGWTAEWTAEWTEGWCEQCAARSPLTAPEQAAALTGIKTRVIYRWAETGMLHSAETEAGNLLVCVNSLGIELPARQSRRLAGAPDADTLRDHAESVDYTTRRDAPYGNEAPTLELMAVAAQTKRLSAALEYAERNVDDVLVIGLRGRLDNQAAANFEQRFLSFINAGARQLAFDCSALDSISSAGLRSFLNAARRLTTVGSRITLYSLNEAVARAFRTTGFASLFRIFHTEEEAILGLAITGLLPRLHSQQVAAVC